MRSYIIDFAIEGTDKPFVPRTRQVTLIDGAKFEDIRTILANPLGLKAENIRIKTLVEVV